MQRPKLMLFSMVGLFALACGSPPVPRAPSEPAPAPASAPSAPGVMAPGVTGEPSNSGAVDQEHARQSERPGLATSWGERRESRAWAVRFLRANPDQPFATVSLFYNDRAGVRAMARQRGISDFGDNLARVAGGAITVRLLDASGHPLPGVRAGEQSYVIGHKGQRYVIEIKNHTGSRFEAVATVDGLDVMDGLPGSFQKRGYVLHAFRTLDIDGFRRSEDSVATFRFGSVKDSYAARTGNDRNVGVIGVAFFQEKGSSLPWTQQEIERRRTADPFPGRFASPPR